MSVCAILSIKKEKTNMFLNDFAVLAQSCFDYVASPSGLVTGLFLMGLVGGITHCAGMCGPFILSQTGHMEKLRDGLLIPYHLGRLLTYTALAVILYFVVNLIGFFAPFRLFIVVPLLSLAGLLFIVNAFPGLLSLFPWAGRIALPVSQNLVFRMTKGTSNRFLMGMTLGLMPCGMVMAAVMAASSAPTLWGTIYAMAAFGLGTMPSLFMIGIGGRAATRQFPEAMARIRQGMMVWSGIWLFAMAGFLVFERMV